MNWENLADLLTVLSVIGGFYMIHREIRKDSLWRNQHIYDSLHNEYLRFLEHCLANPHLNLYEGVKNQAKTDPARTQELILAEILINLMERTYLLYHMDLKEVREAQWVGWKNWMAHHFKNPIIQEVWTHSENGNAYDKRFAEFANRHFLAATGATATGPQPANRNAELP